MSESIYSAIIVEPRQHKALSFVLQNFLNNLSIEWEIIICHGTDNIDYLNDILIEFKEKYTHKITLINLNVQNLTISEYNKLLTSKEFYDYIPTEMFLVFQTDTMIFKQNKDLIYNFLEYDYVGAPWNHYPVEKETVGNGGLSLRRKSKMLEIIEKCPYNNGNEDVYFCWQPNIDIKKPDFETAKKFSVEGTYNKNSFGCHKPWVLPTNEFIELKYYYPLVEKLYNLNH